MAIDFGFFVGALIPVALLSLLFRFLLRKISNEYLRLSGAVFLAWLVTGVLSGMGLGEGGFERRFETALSGVGFIAYALPALVVLVVLLLMSFVKGPVEKAE